MTLYRVSFLALIILSLFPNAALAFKTIVRGGCIDEVQCCAFDKNWKLNQSAVAYENEDGTHTLKYLKKNQELKAIAGIVETESGSVKLLRNFKRWKKGEVIDVYTEPKDPTGKVRVGFSDSLETVDDEFLRTGKKCSPVREDCWGQLISRPKVSWWVKVELDENTTGWVDGFRFAQDDMCIAQKTSVQKTSQSSAIRRKPTRK